MVNAYVEDQKERGFLFCCMITRGYSNLVTPLSMLENDAFIRLCAKY